MQNTVRVSVQLPQSVSDAIATMQRAAPGKVPPAAAVVRELIERGLAANRWSGLATTLESIDTSLDTLANNATLEGAGR